MKVLYVSQGDPRDIRTFSGTALHKLRAFESLGHEIQVLQLERHPIESSYGRLKFHLLKKLAGGVFQFDTDPIIRHFWKNNVRRRLRGVSYDMVFSWHPFQGLLVETDKPFVFWYDATFKDSWRTHFPGASADTARNGISLEQKALERCAAAIYSTDWARNNAIEHYGVSPAKVHTVRYGSNLAASEDLQTIDRIITDRPKRWSEELRLFFVGHPWEWKGGPSAVAVARELNHRGIKTSLTVVGATPEIDPADRAFVNVIGKLDKRDPAQLARFQSLYLESDFFVMMSKADSSPIVYCEAMARGLPSIATNVGGVGSIIRNGETGRLFDHGPELVGQIADYLSEVTKDPQGYIDLARSCLEYSQTKFNWDVAAKGLNDVLQTITKAR